MEEKKFNSMADRDEFKAMCMEVLPAIKSIENELRKRNVPSGATVRVGNDGYMALDLHDSKWRMARYRDDAKVSIMFEHREELNVTAGGRLDKVSENLVEISLTFARLQKEHEELSDIDSAAWKQQFVEWANEFEERHPEPEHWADSDYLWYIEKFARQKILEYAHPENDYKEAAE